MLQCTFFNFKKRKNFLNFHYLTGWLTPWQRREFNKRVFSFSSTSMHTCMVEEKFMFAKSFTLRSDVVRQENIKLYISNYSETFALELVKFMFSRAFNIIVRNTIIYFVAFSPSVLFNSKLFCISLRSSQRLFGSYVTKIQFETK